VKYLIFGLVIFSACAQPRNPINIQTLEGAWLGGGIEMDKDVFRPVSQFLLIDSSSQIKTYSGGWRDTFQDLTIRPDSILFPYRSYPRSAVQLNSDRLKIGKSYPLTYKKVEAKFIDIDTAVLKSDFLIGQWVSEDWVLDFSDDKVMRANRSTLEKRQMCWDVNNLEGMKFLQLKGSFNDCNSPYDAIAFLHSISEDSMIIEQWINGDFEKLTYKKEEVDMSRFKFPEFVLCNPNIYENSGGDWYNFKYTSFEGGLYRLKQIYDERYVAVTKGNNEGLVKVSFVINCVGEIGRIAAREMSGDYEDIDLNPEITKQIVTILEQAGNWIPGERRDQKLDTYKFLIFKIRDGKINEIFP